VLLCASKSPMVKNTFSRGVKKARVLNFESSNVF